MSKNILENKKSINYLTQKEFKKFFNTIPAMIWEKDKEGKYLQVNKFFVKSVGIPEKKILGKTDFDLYPKELALRYEKDDKQIVSSGKPIREIIEQYKRASGELGWIMTSKLPYYDKDKKIIGTIGFAVDITTQKEAEKELRVHYNLLDSIMEGVTEAIFVKDIKGRYLIINSAGAKMLGKTIKEIIGKDDTELFSKEDAIKIKHSDALVIESKKPQTTEEYLSPGGKFAVLLTIRAPHLNSKGEVAGIIGVTRDITEQTKSRELIAKFTRKTNYNLANIIPILQKASKGSFSENIEVPSKQDEFFDLVAVLNVMISELKKYSLGKEEYDKKIEKKVQERTGEIREEKERAEMIADVIPSGMFAVDVNHHIISWNKAAEKITGYSAKDAIGKECSAFKGAPCKGKCALCLTDVEKLQKTKDIEGIITDQECSITRKDGKKRIVSKNFDLLKDINGKIIGSIETFFDITERKRVEEERMKRQERLERMNKLMVGRELRMIELKDEIKELEKKLNKLK